MYYSSNTHSLTNCTDSNSIGSCGPCLEVWFCRRALLSGVQALLRFAAESYIHLPSLYQEHFRPSSFSCRGVDNQRSNIFTFTGYELYPLRTLGSVVRAKLRTKHYKADIKLYSVIYT